MRRAQNQSLREMIRETIRGNDVDGWLMPERHECSFNDVWSWGRDGKQRPLNRRDSQYNNPYAYICVKYTIYKTDQDVYRRWFQRMQHDDEFIAYASRK
jgi:hypothetical protein